jgi:hypothetical protein
MTGDARQPARGWKYPNGRNRRRGLPWLRPGCRPRRAFRGGLSGSQGNQSASWRYGKRNRYQGILDSLHITVRERGKKQDQSLASPTFHSSYQTYSSALHNHGSDDAAYPQIPHKPLSRQRCAQRLACDNLMSGKTYHDDDVLVQTL